MQTGKHGADEFPIFQSVSGIQDRVAHRSGTAREADILVRLGVLVMRLAARQMTVIVVLVYDHDRGRAIDGRPIFPAGFVDHPVVPAGTADGEIRDVCVTGFREQEEIASSGTMELSLTVDGGP